MKGNSLLRLGLISLDSRQRGHPKWGYSFDITVFQRTVSFLIPIPVQYFDQYDIELTPMDGAPNGNGSRTLSITSSYRIDMVQLRRAEKIAAMKLLL